MHAVVTLTFRPQARISVRPDIGGRGPWLTFPSSLTVAMMSRITLHLRKQARSREADAQLQTYSLTTISRTTTSGLRSRLRFTRSTDVGQFSTDPGVAVNVEESVVTYDDRGNVLSEVADPNALKTPTSPDGEWFEVRPPAPVRLATSRSARRAVENDPELRFVV